jgi:hypothetical protein
MRAAETTNRPRFLRSIVALLAGLIAVVVLSLGTDVALHAVGVFPPWNQVVSDKLLLLATAYRTVYGVIGGYLTARLAPFRPMRHALAGGVVGIVLGTVGAVTTWDQGPVFGSHWYALALIGLALPQSWLGGKLREIQLHAAGAPAIK